MRGDDDQQLGVFSYVSPEQRVPQEHPLRPIRAMAMRPCAIWRRIPVPQSQHLTVPAGGTLLDQG
jgi:hypothetical protein